VCTAVVALIKSSVDLKQVAIFGANNISFSCLHKKYGRQLHHYFDAIHFIQSERMHYFPAVPLPQSSIEAPFSQHQRAILFFI
jgi:hypothetical protein